LRAAIRIVKEGGADMVKVDAAADFPEVVTALTRAGRMTDLLKDCISFSGDVDTAAAIALAAGSCCAESAGCAR